MPRLGRVTKYRVNHPEIPTLFPHGASHILSPSPPGPRKAGLDFRSPCSPDSGWGVSQEAVAGEVALFIPHCRCLCCLPPSWMP